MTPRDADRTGIEVPLDTSGRPAARHSGLVSPFAPRNVVIFGAAEFAALVGYLIENDSPHRVVAHTVDRPWCTQSNFGDHPLIPFEDLEQHHPPEASVLLLALGGRGVNGLRAAKYEAARQRGYECISYVSSRAIVWPNLQIGDNCIICDSANVNPFARIGNNCILRSGSLVSHHAVVGDHCFLAAGAIVAGSARVGERCFIGLNATIRDGINVAARCFIGAGAVVTADTEENGIYLGVPARRQAKPADQLEGC
jgi:sugar O-acyltransferase (sialic acid O-acetyltransferase NeuD family)